MVLLELFGMVLLEMFGMVLLEMFDPFISLSSLSIVNFSDLPLFCGDA